MVRLRCSSIRLCCSRTPYCLLFEFADKEGERFQVASARWPWRFMMEANLSFRDAADECLPNTVYRSKKDECRCLTTGMSCAAAIS